MHHKTEYASAKTGKYPRVIIHQIFSLARDWSKCVTWLNMPQLKMGHIRVIFPNFQNYALQKNIWRIINTIASIWGKNKLGYLSLDTVCSSKLTVFLELCSRKTLHFSEQIMFVDKYPSIFYRQMEAIVYIHYIFTTLFKWCYTNVFKTLDLRFSSKM